MDCTTIEGPTMSALRVGIKLSALILAAGLTMPALATEQQATGTHSSGGLQPTTQMAEVRSQSAGITTASNDPAAIVTQGISQPTAARKAAIASPNSSRRQRYAAPRTSEPSLILGVRF